MKLFTTLLNLIRSPRKSFVNSSYPIPRQPEITNPDQSTYPYVYMHNEGCKGESFYLKTVPAMNSNIIAFDHVYPNGMVPASGTAVVCYECMYPVEWHSANVIKRK